MTTEPIKIEFAINSTDLNEEFKRIVTGAKNPDEAIDALRERFKQLNAEQLLGIQGMEDVAKAMLNMGQEASKVKLENIGITKEDVALQKTIIKELEAELKAFKKTVDEMAPGLEQNKQRDRYSLMSAAVDAEKKSLQEMTNELGQTEEAHKSLASQVRSLLEEMRQLELQGKKNTDEYRKLKDEAAYLEEIRKRTRASLRGENDDMRALSAGVNLLAGSYSTAMGVVGMFTDDTAKMERIQTKMQSAIALTVGVQQVSEGLAKESIVLGKIQAIQATALAKAKNLEATNTGKATIAQRMYNMVAKANPYVLLATAVLSLGAAYAVMRLAIGGATEEQRKLNKEIGKEAASSIAEPLLKYKTLQRQWQSLNGDLKKQNEFLEENKGKFAELGVQVDNVNDAENLLVNSSSAFIEAMMLRARATAQATIAQKKYEESLLAEDAFHQQREDLKGNNGWWNKFLTETKLDFKKDWGKLTGNPYNAFEYKSLEREADKWLDESLKLQEEATELLKKHGIKTVEDLANERLKTEKKTSEQIISERKKLWEDYYAFEATFGKAVAKKQFASLREESKSYFEWLEKEKAKYTDEASEGNLNTQDLEYLTAITQALADLQGQKTGLEEFTQDLERSLRHAPDLVAQLDVIDDKIKELSTDKANIDSGAMSFVVGKKEDIERELEEQALLFVQAHLSLADKKLAIDKKYLELSKQIALLDLSDEGYQHQLNELEKAKEEELKALEDAEKKKVEIVERYSESLIGITKRQLLVRIASLEEYLSLTKNALNDEQREHLKAELTKAKALASTKGLSIEINALLQERKQLLDKIKADAAQGIVNEEDVAHLDKLNQELKNKTSKTFSEIAEYAGQIAGGFYNLSDSLQDINPSLAETLETIGDIASVAEDAAGAIASFAVGGPAGIIGGITGVMNVVSGIFSIGSRARARRRQEEAEIKQWQDEVYQAGLDYNRILRDQLITEIEINAAYKSRLDTIKELMDASSRNLANVERDINNVLQRLFESETLVNPMTRAERWFHNYAKTGVKEFDTIANLLKEMNNGVDVDMTDLDTILDMLAELNSKKPLTGDAKTAYEQLLALKEEYGSLTRALEEYERQLKDVLAGTTAAALADGIIEGLKAGKRSIADFGDDIEEILRNAILSGLQDTIFKEAIQNLQDYIAEAMTDGELTQEEADEIRRMWEAIVNRSAEMMDQMDQTGLDLFGPGSDKNSLRGAYKAASQESIDLLSGHTAAMRLTQMETNSILSNSFSTLLQLNSNMYAAQLDIELNTRRTADNTTKLYSIDAKLLDLLRAVRADALTFSANGLRT
ncbi:MAG TPA: hypothetical protein VK050_08680 [Flavobacteriaceae bacterium]|nr:hypothetical protein [Flavobacteriaceae bacterium]